MSFRQFLSEWHVQVAQSAGQRMIEKVLADRGVELKVAVRLPSFLGVSLILVNTDLVVTVPDLLGRSLATSPLRHVKAIPAPFAAPTYTERQHWHERYHNDLQSQWLRQTVADLFMEPDLPSGDGLQPKVSRKKIAKP